MGETANLQTALGGQFNLNDWLGQLDQAATPKGIVPVILPVQEMRGFQRRYVFDSGSVNLVLGQRISLTEWTVPLNEWWRPRALFFKNGDSADHDISTIVPIDPSAPLNVYLPSRTRVVANTAKVVYGNDQDGSMATAIDTFYMSELPVTLEPLSTFGFFDEDIVVAAGALMEWTFIYELVPAPATKLARGVKGAVTVV